MRRLFALVPIVALVGCSSAPEGELPRPDLSQRKARVVVTTSMIADLVRTIGGAHTDLHVLMRPGIDPHQYRATSGDYDQLRKADLILYNGLHLEGRMADVFEEMGRRVRTVAVTQTMDQDSDLLQAEPGFESAHDPHVWFDALLWSKAALRVRDALIDLDPAHADAYRSTAEDYVKRLTVLHDELKQLAQQVPAAKRVVITAHDAFRYFGRAYGFQVKGLQGISTATEPGTRDVDNLAAFIAENRIPAIFGETSVPSRGIEAVQRAVKSRSGFDVKFLGEQLFSDSLGDEGSPAGTYEGMMRANMNLIVGELKGGS